MNTPLANPVATREPPPARPMARVVAAFVLVPLVVPLLLLAASDRDGVPAALAAWSTVYTYGLTLGFGLPLLFVFRRNGWWRWWQFALGGIFAGVAWSLTALSNGWSHWSTAAFFSMYCIPLGLVHGLLFWLVAVWRNTGLTRRDALDAGQR